MSSSPRFVSASSGFEEQSRAYRQERLRMFCFLGLVLGGSLYAGLRLVQDVFGYAFWGVLSARALILSGAIAISAALWVVLRRRALSSRALLYCDAVGIWVWVAACLGAMAIPIGSDVGVTSFVLGIFLLARAIIVPSSVRRTLFLSALPVLAFAGVLLLRGNAQSLEGTYDAVLLQPIVAIYTMILAVVAALAGAVSRILFRLRREVHASRQLGPYSIEEKIGEGGMGEVHRARHGLLRRPTAVKLVRGQLDAQSLKRFEREVWMTSRLTHPNTIVVYDYGQTAEGVFYYAMELLEGADLGDVLEASGPMPAARVIHVLVQACGALQEAHDHGLVHRDVKPGNLFLCERGGQLDVIKIMDFGLVKSIDVDSGLTHADAIIGTPRYLSPEAFTEEGVDAGSDLYALGAVAYELLTNHFVFEANSAREMIGKLLNEEPAPLSTHRADIPADLERVVLRCLAKEPRDRPACASALSEELMQCADAGRWTQGDARAWWQKHFPDRMPAHTR